MIRKTILGVKNEWSQGVMRGERTNKPNQVLDFVTELINCELRNGVYFLKWKYPNEFAPTRLPL